MFPDINPFVFKTADFIDSADGGNLVFYDNHIRWHPLTELEDVGTYLPGYDGLISAFSLFNK